MDTSPEHWQTAVEAMDKAAEGRRPVLSAGLLAHLHGRDEGRSLYGVVLKNIGYGLAINCYAVPFNGTDYGAGVPWPYYGNTACLGELERWLTEYRKILLAAGATPV